MNLVSKGIRCVLLVLIGLMQVQCSKYNEPAPFFDGLILEYKEETKLKTREITFNVESLNDGQFQIVETRIPKLLLDNIHKMQVDRYGRVSKSTLEHYVGKFSPIWIPVTKLKINDKFDGRKKIVRIELWREWEVVVVKDIHTGSERYYDSSTGYLVGGFVKAPVGSLEKYLVETNANLSVVEVE